MKRIPDRLLLAALGFLASCAPLRPTAPDTSLPADVLMLATEPAATASGGSILLAAPGRERGSYHVWAVDAGNGVAPGQGAPDFTVPGRAMGAFALSPDGQRLAIATGSSTYCEPLGIGTACWDGSETVSLVDLTTGRADPIDLPKPSRVSQLAFDSSGQHLAMVVHAQGRPNLVTVDVSLARIAGQSTLPIDPSFLAYAADDASLVLFGSDPGSEPGLSPPGPAQVLILQESDLSVLWNETIDGMHMGSWCIDGCGSTQEPSRTAIWYPAYVLQPGSDRLLVLHAEANRLTAVDIGRRLVESMEIGPAKTWLDRLMAWGTSSAEAKGWAEGAIKQAVISPDGSRLYDLGRLLHATANQDGSVDGWEEPLGLDVVDPVDGVRLAHLDTDASGLGISKDGRWLLLARWESYGLVSEVLNAQSLESEATFEDWQILPVLSLEGRSLLLAYSQSESNTRFALIDARTMQRSSAWTVDGFTTVISP